MKNSLQIVLVLYKTSLQDSLSYLAVRKCIASLSIPYSILLYNNSPEVPIEASHDDEYVINASENKMLAGAYNEGLQEAIRKGHSWMLLLDQDTEITADYLQEVSQILTQSSSLQEVALIAPQIFCKSTHQQFSPCSYNPKVGLWSGNQFLSSGIYSDCVSAVNSATLVKTEFIQSIGGFPQEYPLDGMDFAYYYRVYKAGGKVQVMNVHLFHNLSVLDIEHPVSIPRYESILAAEIAFSRELGLFQYIVLKLRTLLRATKWLFIKNKRQFVPTILKFFFIK